MEYTFRLTEQGINKLLKGDRVSYHFGADVIYIVKKGEEAAIEVPLPEPLSKYGTGASPPISTNFTLTPFTGH